MSGVQSTATGATSVDHVTGFGQCVSTDCEAYQELRPITLRIERVDLRAVDLPVVMTVTEHMSTVNDADMLCPECQRPRAIMREKPPVYAKYHSPNLAA